MPKTNSRESKLQNWAFPSDDNHVGNDICIQNESDPFILARIKWCRPRCEGHIGEGLDFLSALNWAHERNVVPVDVELDPKLVTNNFHSNEKDLKEFHVILHNYKIVFSSFYVTIMLSLLWDKQMRLITIFLRWPYF